MDIFRNHTIQNLHMTYTYGEDGLNYKTAMIGPWGGVLRYITVEP